MKITSLTLDGVLGAPDGTYSFTLADDGVAPVVLFRGDEATGKTSILRAIAALKEQGGAYAARARPSSLKKRGRSRGHMSATWRLTEEEQRLGHLDDAEHTTEIVLDDEAVQPLVEPGLRRVFENLEPGRGLGRLELIPASRRLTQHVAVAFEGPSADGRRARDDDDKYADLVAWLLERSTADGDAALRSVRDRGLVSTWDRPDSLAPCRIAVSTLLPRLRLRAVERTAEGPRLTFDRADGQILSLSDLSATERDAVLLAIVVARYKLDSSIALVDEPIRGLTASTGRARFRAWTELVADMQVVAATSDNALVNATPRQLDIALSGPPAEPKR